MKCRSYLFFGDNNAENRVRNSAFENSQLKIRRGRRSELVVSCQVVINPFCGLPVIFCGFISHLIGRETINIPEIFSGVHGFTGNSKKKALGTRLDLIVCPRVQVAAQRNGVTLYKILVIFFDARGFSTPRKVGGGGVYGPVLKTLTPVQYDQNLPFFLP